MYKYYYLNYVYDFNYYYLRLNVKMVKSIICVKEFCLRIFLRMVKMIIMLGINFESFYFFCMYKFWL